jgi:hypothetical protein
MSTSDDSSQVDRAAKMRLGARVRLFGGMLLRETPGLQMAPVVARGPLRVDACAVRARNTPCRALTAASLLA